MKTRLALLWRRSVLGFALVLPGLALGQAVPSYLEDDPAELGAPPVKDPLEGFNRVIYHFNDGFMRYALRPVSKGYKAVVPAPARRGLANVFTNLLYPVRLAGNLLQGRGRGAWIETERFLVNTVAGLGGLINQADQLPQLRLEDQEDLGQAFAKWGLGHGPYLVLPFFGPSSARDGIAFGVEAYFLQVEQYFPEWEQKAAYQTTYVIQRSPELVNTYEVVTGGAIDPYVALRDAYISRRADQVKK